MNILHVVNVFFVIPYFLGNQLRYFKDKGNNLFVICSSSSELYGESSHQGFSYVEIPILRKISVFQDLKSTFQIYKYIKRNNIEIVNGHTPKGALLAMIASFFARVPKRIYFRHGLVFETSKGVKRFLLINIDRLTALFATKIICVSPSVYKKSLDYKLNAEEKQTVLSKGTCNGINLDKFNSNNISPKTIESIKFNLGINKDAVVVGFSGRLVKDKGIIELIQAFLALQKEYNNINLLLVGMFEVRDQLPEDIILEIQNNPLIFNTGYVPNKEIQNYYALMDIYVLPSYREGFPTSVLEASAMKLPVITSRATGCIDSIIEGETGIYAEHDSKSLSEKIQYFIEDVKYRKEVGENGRKFVSENFDEKIIWKEIEKLY